MWLNFILLIIFLTIILWKSKIIEGQANDTPIFSILPNFLEDEYILYEKRKSDNRPKENILSFLDDKGLYNNDDEDMKKKLTDSHKCVDSDDKLTINQYNYFTGISTDEHLINDKKNNNDEHNITPSYNKTLFDIDFLGLNFVGDFSDSDTISGESVLKDNNIDNINKLSEHKMCDLVDILYGENTHNDVRHKISASYGDCFHKQTFKKNGGNFNKSEFQSNCPKSCYNQLSKLPSCNKFVLNASICPEINKNNSDKFSGNLFYMSIKPPGSNLYYNCIAPSGSFIQEKIEKLSPTDKMNASFQMNPKICMFTNKCKKDHSPSPCHNHSEEYCEQQYSGSPGQHLNCILNNPSGNASKVGNCTDSAGVKTGLQEPCENKSESNDYKDCRIESVPGIYLDPKKVDYAITIF